MSALTQAEQFYLAKLRPSDNDVIGIDNDGNAICWSALTQSGYNSGMPPTFDQLIELVERLQP